jgi:hypothetical protein
MSVLNQTDAPIPAVPKAESGDGHFYGYTKERGWFPLYKDGGTFGMREARKLHEAGQIAMPSATGYIKCLNKPHLTDWMMEEVAKACYAQMNSTPANEVWPESDFVEAALETARNVSKPSMDLGTAVHAQVERAIKGEDYDAKYQVYVDAVMKELDAAGMSGCQAELCTGSLKYGIGGKIDMSHDASMSIGDLKTRGSHRVNKVKPSKVPYYESDLMQTACYGYCRYGNAFFISGRAVIFGASTLIPGLVTPHVFTGKELVPAFEAFLALTAVWRYTHSCDPRRPLFEEGVTT